MTIKQRLSEPTPKFFKKVRNIGLALAAVSTVLLASPIALPLAMIKLAGYLAVAGGVAGAVSQVTTGSERKNKEDGYEPQS
jgi:acyl-CoA reductase-like NAD-dependent aldehyde dehydrogenase